MNNFRTSGIAASPAATQPAPGETRRLWPLEIDRTAHLPPPLELTHHHLAQPGEVAEIVSGYQVSLSLNGPVPVAWKFQGHEDRRLLLQGELCTVSHGDYRCLSWDAPLELLRLTVSPNMMADLSRERADGNDVELIAHRGLRDPNIVNLMQMLRASGSAGRLFGEQLGRTIAVYLFERYCVYQPSPRAVATRIPGAVLKKVLAYIDERIAEPISVKDLAAHVRMSQFYFSRLFRNTVGRSPGQYVLDRRMDRAKALLSAPDLSLTEVARLAGFSSESAFASAFRFRNGITPSAYRRLLR